MYKPLIFIFLVVLAPGTYEAMFYFENDVLLFDPNVFALLNVLSSVASIVGVWTYRVFFKDVALRKYLVWTTVGFSVAQAFNLLLVG